MAGSYDAVPQPPPWDPAMAKRRDRVALTVHNVDKFVDWAGSAPMNEVDAVRSAIADGCDDDVVVILGQELNRLPIIDTSRHNVLRSWARHNVKRRSHLSSGSSGTSSTCSRPSGAAQSWRSSRRRWSAILVSTSGSRSGREP